MGIRKDNHDRQPKRQVATYVTPEEWNILACIADGRGETISTLVRRTLNDAYVNKRQPVASLR